MDYLKKKKFLYQSLQIAMDILCAGVSLALTRFAPETWQWQKVLGGLHQSLESLTKTGVHLMSKPPESALDEFLGGLRLVSLLIQMSTGVGPQIFPKYKPYLKLLNRYVVPMAELLFSAEFIFFKTDDWVSEICSFSPEWLLEIPEVENYLLKPDLGSFHEVGEVPMRFRVGRFLGYLQEDNLLKTLEERTGYLNDAQGPIYIWTSRALIYLLGRPVVTRPIHHPEFLERIWQAVRLTQLMSALVKTILFYQADWEAYTQPRKVERMLRSLAVVKTAMPFYRVSSYSLKDKENENVAKID